MNSRLSRIIVIITCVAAGVIAGSAYRHITSGADRGSSPPPSINTSKRVWSLPPNEWHSALKTADPQQLAASSKDAVRLIAGSDHLLSAASMPEIPIDVRLYLLTVVQVLHLAHSIPDPDFPVEMRANAKTITEKLIVAFAKQLYQDLMPINPREARRCLRLAVHLIAGENATPRIAFNALARHEWHISESVIALQIP